MKFPWKPFLKFFIFFKIFIISWNPYKNHWKSKIYDIKNLYFWFSSTFLKSPRFSDLIYFSGLWIVFLYLWNKTSICIYIGVGSNYLGIPFPTVCYFRLSVIKNLKHRKVVFLEVRKRFCHRWFAYFNFEDFFIWKTSQNAWFLVKNRWKIRKSNFHEGSLGNITGIHVLFFEFS